MMRIGALARQLSAIVCCALLVPGNPTTASFISAQEPANDTSAQAPTKVPNDQLDSLVAPIALYPDPLLAQVLAASTYPLELMQLQQWMSKNPGLKDKALTDAVEKQQWDPSVQAMAVLPDVVKRLTEDIQWTTDLGNAFLAQQSDVMDAVQRMRVKAKDTGNLKSSEQQKVETKVVENKQVIVVQPSSPDVVYVPSYNPTVVYGPPAYPYPPVYYPPPGYYAAGMAISFGVGMAIGAAWGGGGWGWGCGWGSNNNITINNNNNFVRNSNRQNNLNNVSGNRVGGGGNSWQHNPQHRGGTPYSDRATANKYGGTARGGSGANRQANQGQPGNRQQSGSGNLGSNRAGGAGTGANNSANRSATSSGGNNLGSRAGADGAAGRGGGGDRVGNRSVPSGGGSSTKGGAFGEGSGGMSGNSARASGQRGASSMGRGGGSRGGGGRRR
jgi:hypothetical protein